MRKPNVILIVFLLMVFRYTLLYAKRPDCTVNSDIVITGFETIVMEQGKSNVRPEFRVKNRGSRTYVSVKLKYNMPEGIDRFGEEVSLFLGPSLYISTTFEPGEEKPVIGAVNLRTTLKQEKTTYATKCWFEFADKEGNLYRSPFHKLREFVRVIPYNEDVVLLDYRPVVLEQGEDNVYPVFQLKNRGKRTYTSVLLKFDKPRGKYETGRLDSLYIRTNRFKKLSLEPGEEVTLNPARHPVSYIRARNNQSLGTYSAKYCLKLVDSDGCAYITPRTKIKEFARVIPRNKD